MHQEWSATSLRTDSSRSLQLALPWDYPRGRNDVRVWDSSSEMFPLVFTMSRTMGSDCQIPLPQKFFIMLPCRTSKHSIGLDANVDMRIAAMKGLRDAAATWRHDPKEASHRRGDEWSSTRSLSRGIHGQIMPYLFDAFPGDWCRSCFAMLPRLP